MLKELKKFAMRGNVVDMAVGFTVGAAFATIAKSLVNDILMPPIGLLTGNTDFADHYLLLKAGTDEAPPYATLADAQAAGAVTLNWGLFVNSLMTFLIVAIAMFVIVRSINRLEAELEEHFGDEEPTDSTQDNKKCPYCRTTIKFKASRCPNCTSELKSPPTQQSPTHDETGRT